MCRSGFATVAEQHAVYLAVVTQHFQQHLNVTFDSVEAFNEPNSDWWKASGTQEGCHFSPSTQASVIAVRMVQPRRCVRTRAHSRTYRYGAVPAWWRGHPAAVHALCNV